MADVGRICRVALGVNRYDAPGETSLLAQFEGYKKFRPWAGNFQSQHTCRLLSAQGPLAIEGEGAGANNHPCPGQRQSVWPFREEHIS